jgi:cell division protein ZapA
MKQIEVQIMGNAYILACPEGGESRLLEAVERVDTAMCTIRDTGKIRARDRIAVLAALNLAFDLADRISNPVWASEAQSPQTNKSEPNQQANDSEADPTLTSLLERLDVALDQDGQLI